jgi:hypothetical protein
MGSGERREEAAMSSGERREEAGYEQLWAA